MDWNVVFCAIAEAGDALTRILAAFTVSKVHAGQRRKKHAGAFLPQLTKSWRRLGAEAVGSILWMQRATHNPSQGRRQLRKRFDHRIGAQFRGGNLDIAAGA
jgi:hypothetical protein